MDTRKIQEVGGGTYTVSVPHEWAETEDIEQGDRVDVHTHIDGVLVIQPQDRGPNPVGEVAIEVCDPTAEQLHRILWAAYTAGYTEVTLAARDTFTDTHRAAVRQLVRTLAGVTLTDESEDRLTVQVLLDSGEVSVQQLVRQLSFVALSMHRDAMAAVTRSATTAEFADRDDQADRLYAIADRSFARALSRLSEVDTLGFTRSELFELWSTARDLERIADHAERIAAIGDELDGPPETHGDDLQQVAEQAQEVVDRAVSGVVGDAGADGVYDALTLRSEVRERVRDLDRRLFVDATADYRLARVLDSVGRTAEHGGNIAERGLQRVIRQGAGDGVPDGLDPGVHVDRPVDLTLPRG